MTSAARVPPHVPTLTEVVSWPDSALPAHWIRPDAVHPDLVQEVQARVLSHIQLLLPGLVAQALHEALQKDAPKSADN